MFKLRTARVLEQIRERRRLAQEFDADDHHKVIIRYRPD